MEESLSYRSTARSFLLFQDAILSGKALLPTSFIHFSGLVEAAFNLHDAQSLLPVEALVFIALRIEHPLKTNEV
ncbi:hypothetical protein F0562_002427 [Nyssa sinensis]|uniref:Uncharacterized protein n=1 Tax=Nyssa sinensis TaxID=561372 RepID=A0A5J5C5U8_9ASTE|nr:hypothetical protein F0562_002427 [Nyssa sinensis]